MKYIAYLAAIVCCLAPVVCWGQNIGLGTTVPLTSVHMHDANANHTKVLITSVAINDSASLFLTEDVNGVFGMGWLYDGIGNFMHLYGHSNLDYLGPHITVQRDNPTHVGIGVTNPLETLHVGGGVRLGNTSNTAAGTIRWSGTDFEGYNGSSWKTLTAGGKWSEQGGMPSNIYYTAGSVGIGTASPSHPLDIQSTSSLSVVDISNLYTGIQGQTGVKVSLTNQGSGDKYGFYSQISNNAASNDNALYGMYTSITSSTSGIHYGLYADIEGDGHYAVYGKNGSASGWAGYFEGKTHVGSSLSIGTEAELGQLHVHSGSEHTRAFITPVTTGSGDSSSVFLAEDDDGTWGMSWVYDGINNEMQLFGKAQNVIYGPHLRVERNTGDMALGDVFATDHRLSVDGKIACEEVRVELSGAWPDYVFEAGYEKLSLQDLKTYIDANGHLPGVPGATEIAEDGLEVGAMQRTMMEKIEELTLYILELSAEVRVLQAENVNLKQRIGEFQDSEKAMGQ